MSRTRGLRVKRVLVVTSVVGIGSGEAVVESAKLRRKTVVGRVKNCILAGD